MAKPKITPIQGDHLPLPLEKPRQKRPGRPLSSEWVKGSLLKQKYDFSDEHLKRLRDEGTLKRNVHWKHIGRTQAVRPTYRYHLDRCEQALEALREERE